MTTLATRMQQLTELEGFDIGEVKRGGETIPRERNGFPKYNYDRKAKSACTVEEWKRTRFREVYEGCDCEVLMGDGRVAHGSCLLSTLRASYEEE